MLSGRNYPSVVMRWDARCSALDWPVQRNGFHFEPAGKPVDAPRPPRPRWKAPDPPVEGPWVPAWRPTSRRWKALASPIKGRWAAGGRPLRRRQHRPASSVDGMAPVIVDIPTVGELCACVFLLWFISVSNEEGLIVDWSLSGDKNTKDNVAISLQNWLIINMVDWYCCFCCCCCPSWRGSPWIEQL